MSKNLSIEQEKILKCKENMVVLANPGSGKTFMVCEMIKKILQDALEYEGVIGISYTNKASKELKERLLAINKKNSYFNTLDTFLLVEIIYPFGCHVFRQPTKEIKISDEKFSKYKEEKDFKDLSYEKKLEKLYCNGIILLETMADLAINIIDKSLACKRYLKARYKYIFIDEYQDCDNKQHKIFLKIVSLGIKGVAVGDPDQSIYGFAEKSSKYLLDLSKREDFECFVLTKNYRSKQGIINYSLKLLNNKYLIKNSEKCVFYKRVEGSQIKICEYIDNNIEQIIERFSVNNYKEIGILVRSKTTGKIINKNLKLKHKYFEDTDLDKNSSTWGRSFKKLIIYYMNNENTYAFCEEFFDSREKKFLELYNMLTELKKIDNLNEFSIQKFIEIAKLLYPYDKNKEAIELLKKILKDKQLQASYKEAEHNEIQIMTIHKSKGLEFQVVIHLDLYKYILPLEGYGINGIWGEVDINECLNLHYVGVTRAKEACILITSTKRFNGKGELKEGIDSKFLLSNELINL